MIIHYNLIMFLLSDLFATMAIYSVLFDVQEETGGEERGVGVFKSDLEGDGDSGGTVLSGGTGNTFTLNVVIGGSVLAICVFAM